MVIFIVASMILLPCYEAAISLKVGNCSYLKYSPHVILILAFTDDVKDRKRELSLYLHCHNITSLHIWQSMNIYIISFLLFVIPFGYNNMYESVLLDI